MDAPTVDRRRRLYLLGLLTQGALGSTSCGGSSAEVASDDKAEAAVASAAAPVPDVRFPLRVEAGKRHIVDAAGRPFLVHGDTAWSIVGQLTNTEIDVYLADRSSRGFTAILFSAPEAYYTNQTPSYNNVDGVAPFRPMTQFASPTEDYWKRVDHLVNQAKTRKLACVVNPAYLGYQTDGWLDAVNAASEASLRNYGAWLASRYTQGNIIWCLGGDHDTPAALLKKQWNIVDGMRTVRKTDIITAHPMSDGANADDAYTYWSDMAGFNLNAIYGYETNGFFTNTLCAQAWRRGMPFLGFEFKYENSQGATLAMLRRQSYGSLLSGACGQIYGNLPIWSFESDRWTGETYPGTWQTNLSSAGAIEQGYVKALFAGCEWWKLMPKIDRSLVTSFLGSQTGRIYPALASDASFALIYVPLARSVSVLMSAFASDHVRARLYNPKSGRYEAVAGSPFPNIGTRNFTITGERVIVLDAGS